MSDMPKGRTKEVSDAELIQAGLDSRGPSFTSREVADAVGLNRDTVRERLNGFVERGVLQQKTPGGFNIYWVKSGWDEVTNNPLAEP